MTWLPNAEMKLMSMSLIATNPRSVRIQIEEFKVPSLIVFGDFCIPYGCDNFTRIGLHIAHDV